MSDLNMGANMGAASHVAIPSTLDLVRLSRRPLFAPGGRDLYQRIALLTDMREGQELLVAPSGPGTVLEYFVREFRVLGSGVDEDAALGENAEARARATGIQGDRIQIQRGSMDALPYRDGVFDVVIGELDLTARVGPEVGVAELARVLKPGGRIALLQLVWKAPVEPARREVLARHLGARPLMLVELKRILLEAGIEGLHTEGWSGDGVGLRGAVEKPFPDFAELFSLPEKLGILRRALSRWGWRGVATALARGREVHRLLTRERILGLTVIVGRKALAEVGYREEFPEEVGDLPLFAQGERR